MKNIYQMRNEFTLREYNTAITREDFEKHFNKTREKVRFTFAGWDGKSYDNESRSASVYRTDIKGYEDVRFIKVGKHLHYIDEESLRVEKATDESLPEAEWLVDVLTAKKEA
ncbi:MAG: hypothetical protein J6I76_01430 [Oribacterium sp.]|nr:hypothetical protein [Oribacterium sp.]